MANLKNITDLPVAESAEGLNLIVNDNGAAKQIAASAVGAQADWTETDETSPAFIVNKPEIPAAQIQADWTETDETSPAFIKNKPVEELDLDLKIDITWNTETSEPNDPVITANDGYSYEAFVAKIESGEIPKVKIVVNFARDETQSIVEFVNNPVITKPIQNGVVMACTALWFGAINLSAELVVLMPDGNFIFQAPQQ